MYEKLRIIEDSFGVTMKHGTNQFLLWATRFSGKTCCQSILWFVKKAGETVPLCNYFPVLLMINRSWLVYLGI